MATKLAMASVLAVLVTCSAAENVVLDWNAVMMAGVRQDNTGPTLSTRNLAILHLALYDAANSITRSHQPYQFQVQADKTASLEAAVSAAGYEILKSLYPTLRARSDETYETWRAGAPNNAATTNGINVGIEVAQMTLMSRSSDGATTDVPYIPSDLPGRWRRTPPFFRPPVTPQWRHVSPFALDDIERFVPPPPPALDSTEYARGFDEVKVLGGRNSTARTAEQTQIAIFWSDFSYTAMPPGHWHEIAATIVRSRNTGLEETARFMALLSIAQADAAIVCWEAKYRYDLWRPITAIQRANEDGNAATEADPSWEQLLAAPPFPSYTSGHSTFSKASAEVISWFYGDDRIAFNAVSDSLPGVQRSFDSLAACADEVGMSRIYGGIHFSFDNIAGKKCGAEIADFAVANYLLDNSVLPFLRMEPGLIPSVRVFGHFGKQVIVDKSVDLIHWEPISTNQVRMGGVALPVTIVGKACAFFQVREI